MMKTVIFFLCASTTMAFQPTTMMNRVHAPAAAVTRPTALSLIMSNEETEVILNHAQDCVNSDECPVDEVDELVQVLKATEKDLEERLENVMNMIGHLQHINDKKERNTDEVRAFVHDMLRVFNTDKPSVFPTGFSGDALHGKNTAFDVLPPKKWKPTSN